MVYILNFDSICMQFVIAHTTKNIRPDDTHSHLMTVCIFVEPVTHSISYCNTSPVSGSVNDSQFFFFFVCRVHWIVKVANSGEKEWKCILAMLAHDIFFCFFGLHALELNCMHIAYIICVRIRVLWCYVMEMISESSDSTICNNDCA